MNTVRGFTLLEVLVALAILAIALGALVQTGATNAANAAYLRDKTFAHWVAMNKTAEIQLEAVWPAVGSRDGTVEMAGREWRWKVKVSTTPDENVRRMDVSVATEAADDQPLDSVTAFLPRPP